jgi:hypothetical protein
MWTGAVRGSENSAWHKNQRAPYGAIKRCGGVEMEQSGWLAHGRWRSDIANPKPRNPSGRGVGAGVHLEPAGTSGDFAIEICGAVPRAKRRVAANRFFALAVITVSCYPSWMCSKDDNRRIRGIRHDCHSSQSHPTLLQSYECVMCSCPECPSNPETKPRLIMRISREFAVNPEVMLCCRPFGWPTSIRMLATGTDKFRFRPRMAAAAIVACLCLRSTVAG